MAQLIFDRPQVLKAIDAVVERTMRMDLTWDWPCGVAYYGICEAFEATGEPRYLDLVKARVDELLEGSCSKFVTHIFPSFKKAD